MVARGILSFSSEHLLEHGGSSSLARDQTHGPHTGSSVLADGAAGKLLKSRFLGEALLIPKQSTDLGQMAQQIPKGQSAPCRPQSGLSHGRVLPPCTAPSLLNVNTVFLLESFL